jgi:hypothetical protein
MGFTYPQEILHFMLCNGGFIFSVFFRTIIPIAIAELTVNKDMVTACLVTVGDGEGLFD